VTPLVVDDVVPINDGDEDVLLPVEENQIFHAWLLMQLETCRGCVPTLNASGSSRKWALWLGVAVILLLLSLGLPSLITYLSRCSTVDTMGSPCKSRDSLLLGVIFFAVWLSEIVILLIVAMISLFFSQYCVWLKSSYQQARMQARDSRV
jgi:hypothetical protein